MDASRLRLGSAAEWAVAVVFLVATVGVSVLIIREMTTIGQPVNPPPQMSPSVVPAGLPAVSIPVSLLKLPGGRELRLGDTLEKVSSLLGREAETGVQVVEQGRMGTRLTRGYEYAHIRFTIVFEPFERNAEFRVAGIYVQ
jgi:hypothetical protein